MKIRRMSMKFPFVALLLLFSPCLSAQDKRGPLQASRPPVLRTSAQNGFTTWHLDVNSGCIFSDHSYTLDIPVDPTVMSDITYTMTNFDVDYNDPQGCQGGPEVDIMQFNGHNLGILTGANNSSSLNSWSLQKSQVVRGSNQIFIDTDSTGTGCWCVGVGYIEVKAKTNFQVSSHTPADKDKNRDFHAAKLDLRVKFNADYDPATLNSNTFKLEYLDQSSNPQQVPGSFTQVSMKEFRFVPSADLKDGVRYRATVLDGPNGVKAKSGAGLNQKETWSFWTVPNLDLTDNFDYGAGTVCPPSTAPCPGLELAVFQVARNRNMVPGKRAVARLYLRWHRHTDVAPGDQVTEMQVDARLNLASGTIRQTVKRPDKYTAAEIAAAQQTVNFYHKPSTNFSYSVKVTPKPQTNATVVEYNQTKSLSSHSASPRLKYNYYTLKDGLWSGGVPVGVQPASSNFIASGNQFITDQFPVLGTSHKNRGKLTVGYTLTGAMVAEGACGMVREVNCSSGKKSELRCIDEKLSSMLGGFPLVAITVPNNLCPPATSFALGKVFMHQFGTGANEGTVAHEVGHTLGISKANSPNTGHRDSSVGVEGFQVRLKVNKSNIENPSKSISLMNRFTRPTNERWIHSEDYDDLLGVLRSVTALRASGSEYLIVMGTVNTSLQTVKLEPAFLQEVPNDPLSATGECLVQLMNAGGQTLSETHVDPGAEILLVTSGGREVQGQAQGLNEDRFFSASLPWDPAARKVRVGCQGVVYLESEFSPHTPQVTMTNPSDGATLSGTVNIEWSGSDSDGPGLSYQLQLSLDGETWTPLTPLIAGTQFSLDTTMMDSDDEAFLRIMATDGFNTAYDTTRVAISNDLQVAAVQPTGDGVSPTTTVSALFITRLDVTSLNTDSLQVFAPNGDRIAGSWSLEDEEYQLEFRPDNPLEHATEYQVSLSSDLRDVQGHSLGTPFEWTFTTEGDGSPPRVISTSPEPSEFDVPIDSLVQATFDEAMEPATINGSSFQLLDDHSLPVAGTVSYDGNSRRAVFVPSQPLAPDSQYLGRITTAVQDQAGNALPLTHEWTFSTSSSSSGNLRITGIFSDQANDTNGDNRFDNLTIFVQVEVLHNGTYNLNGRLLDKSDRLIDWATSGNVFLSTGYHTMALIYPSAPIRANGVDGPYFLTSLNFYDAADPSLADTQLQAYQTFPYSVADFFATLIFGNLPNLTVQSNGSLENAFNLRNFTSHATLPVSAITYRVFINSDARIHVMIDEDANVDIHPDPDIRAESDIIIEATDGQGSRALATFHVSVQGQGQSVTEIPTLSAWGLGALVFFLAVLTLKFLKRTASSSQDS